MNQLLRATSLMILVLVAGFLGPGKAIADDGALSSLSETLEGEIEGIEDTIDNTIGDVTGAIDDTIGDVTGTVDDIVGDVTGTIDDTIGDVTGGIDDVVGDITGTIDDTIDSTIGDVTGGVDDIVGDVTGGILGGSSGGNVDVTLSPAQQEAESSSTVDSTFELLYANLSEGFQNAISIQAGALGIPDFTVAQASFEQTILGNASDGLAAEEVQGADMFTLNASGLAYSLEGELNRINAQSVAAAVISEEAQLRSQEEAAEAQETLNLIVDTADAAQELDVTQDIMKNLIAVEAQGSSFAAAGIYHSQQIEQQLAVGNVVRSENSEALDEMIRNDRAKDMGAAALLVRTSSQTFLPGEN